MSEIKTAHGGVMVRDQFSDFLKSKIEEGLVMLDEQNRTASVKDHVIALTETVGELLLLARDLMAIRNELTLRHGYRIVR
jgi:hypothetical protein